MTYPTVGQDEFPAICPYLGLADDADSHATYATEAHRCYRLPSPTRIATGHQETYCLGESHTTCPVYRGEGIPRTPTPAPAAAAGVPGPSVPSRPPRQPRPAQGMPAPERRRPSPGAVGPRPRAGGISMPVATVGLFAGAVVLIAIAFLVANALGGDDGDGLSPADVVATNAAANTRTQAPAQTPTVATSQTGTPGATTATAGTATPGASTTPGAAKTYTVKSGDFCQTIADEHNVTLPAFMAANPSIDANCSNLAVGQVVTIP